MYTESDYKDIDWDEILEVVVWVESEIRGITGGEGYTWKTPDKTLSDGYGNCIDQVILMRHILREHGYSDDQLAIIVIKNQETGKAHAVLGIYEDGGYYLINAMSYLSNKYRLLYGFNMRWTWCYGLKLVDLG